MFFKGQGVGVISIYNFRFARGQRIFLISFTPLVIFFPTECPPFLRVEVVILHFGARGQKGAVCFECFSFSGRGLVTSHSGEFGEILCGFCRQTALSPFSMVPQKSECRKKVSWGSQKKGKFSLKVFPFFPDYKSTFIGNRAFYFQCKKLILPKNSGE